jgi:hypothetical protein
LGVNHLAGCVDDFGLGGRSGDVHLIPFNCGSCLPCRQNTPHVVGPVALLHFFTFVGAS